LYRALERGVEAGCDALQIWTKNSRQWNAPPLDPATIEQFQTTRRETGLRPVVAHAAYLINIASPKPDLHRRSTDALLDEVERCATLDVPYLVLHPGAHTGAGMDRGHSLAAQALSEVLAAYKNRQDDGVRILLETTAGQGTTLGGNFESLAWLLEETQGGEELGVCLDTCHVFAAGYDLSSEQGYAEMMAAFERTIGRQHLHAIHLNDSRHPLGSNKDRHEHIGEGHIGLAGFEHLLRDQRLDGLPGILETPKSKDLHEDRENLAALRALV
jgi:deoxyribonuclease-4